MRGRFGRAGSKVAQPEVDVRISTCGVREKLEMNFACLVELLQIKIEVWCFNIVLLLAEFVFTDLHLRITTYALTTTIILLPLHECYQP